MSSLKDRWSKMSYIRRGFIIGFILVVSMNIGFAANYFSIFKWDSCYFSQTMSGSVHCIISMFMFYILVFWEDLGFYSLALMFLTTATGFLIDRWKFRKKK